MDQKRAHLNIGFEVVEDGKFTVYSSSRGIGSLNEKYAERLGDTVQSENILSYVSYEEFKKEDGSIGGVHITGYTYLDLKIEIPDAFKDVVAKGSSNTFEQIISHVREHYPGSN